MTGTPILVDYREKKPYDFPGIDGSQIKEESLNVGDYTLVGFEDRFAVERKTLDDLATSLGTDRERFEDEVRRGQSLDEFVVVIEAPARDVYRYSNSSYCPNYYSNITPNSVIGTVEKWPDKYDTLRFLWANNRKGGMEETLRLLDKWYLKYG